jgi:anti-anti-sigma factor
VQIFENKINDKTIFLQLGAKLEPNAATGEMELDIECQKPLLEKINSVFDTNCNVILDLKNVIYIDSSGLWSLFEGHKKGLQTNLKFILINITKDVKRVFDITKMSSKFAIYNSFEEAQKEV